MYCPILTLVTICCHHRGNYLVWKRPHGNPCINGILVTDWHVVVHILHLYGYRCHRAQGSPSAAVSSHSSEGVLSPVLSVQSPGGADHSCESVHRESPLTAVLCQRVGYVPIVPFIRIKGTNAQDLSSNRYALTDGGMVALTCERGDVIILVQQHQLKLGGGAEWGGAIITGLYVECVILPFLTVKDLCGANSTCVTVDCEATYVVVT